MTDDPRDAIDRPFPEQSTSVYYRIPGVVIDAPAEFQVGSEVGLRVLAVVAPDAEAAAGSCGDRVPAAALRIVDWAGPWLEQHAPTDPPVIAEHILAAAAQGIEAAAKTSDPDAPEAELSRVFARAAIEAVARRIQPTDDEATAMLVGVLRLDVEKLRETGDELATLLDREDADGRTRDSVALWNGQAHNDWAQHSRLRAAKEAAAAEPRAG
jgi:hypothetical protein